MPKKIPVTLISTVYNEAQTITSLLDSITSQTKLPSEIIFVDAGSTDETRKLIKEHAINKTIEVKLFKRSVNRSKARNFAIEKASNQIIAVTDAGCVLDKDWLKFITAPLLKKETDVVAGFYKPVVNNSFQSAVAPFVAVFPEELNLENYLPSSRSVAFTKSAWEKAGKYPAHLNYCEDLVFAKNLQQISEMLVEPKAIVDWRMVNSPEKFFKQISNYTSGDIQARYQPHIRKILTVFGRYLVFAYFPGLLLLYLAWSVHKHRRKTQGLGLVYTPFLQVIADFGVMFGAIRGLLGK